MVRRGLKDAPCAALREGSRLLRVSKYELRARREGYTRIAGVDEAGRGALAGPVVAAAVILPKGARLPGCDDSKKLIPSKREALHAQILKAATAVGVAAIPHDMVDSLNVLRATQAAMRAAIAALQPSPDFVFIDGLPIAQLDIPHLAVVHGDAKVRCIAAASIVAKVERDAIMRELDAKYPGYGFARHKGYGTPEHKAILQARGPSPVHRRSFAPVYLWSQMELPMD